MLCLAELARHIGIDYVAFVESRILQILSPEEVSAIAQEGVDIELHTHHHRLITALGQGRELQVEIEENRKRIVQLNGTQSCASVLSQRQIQRGEPPRVAPIGG